MKQKNQTQNTQSKIKGGTDVALNAIDNLVVINNLVKSISHQVNHLDDLSLTARKMLELLDVNYHGAVLSLPCVFNIK